MFQRSNILARDIAYSPLALNFSQFTPHSDTELALALKIHWYWTLALHMNLHSGAEAGGILGVNNPDFFGLTTYTPHILEGPKNGS